MTQKTDLRRVFAPGCALMLYKPHLAAKLHSLLDENLGAMDLLATCCRHEPPLAEPAEVLSVCPGCHKRFASDYAKTSARSVWEILADGDFFPLPDYRGREIAVLDACPARELDGIHRGVRMLLERMNFSLREPRHSRGQSLCCGDSFWGQLPVQEVKKQMRRRAEEMPAEQVAVYCVSCVKAMFIGGRKPRYLVDLLFSEETVPGTLEPEAWHRELDLYIDRH